MRWKRIGACPNSAIPFEWGGLKFEHGAGRGAVLHRPVRALVAGQRVSSSLNLSHMTKSYDNATTTAGLFAD